MPVQPRLRDPVSGSRIIAAEKSSFRAEAKVDVCPGAADVWVERRESRPGRTAVAECVPRGGLLGVDPLIASALPSPTGTRASALLAEQPGRGLGEHFNLGGSYFGAVYWS